MPEDVYVTKIKFAAWRFNAVASVEFFYSDGTSSTAFEAEDRDERVNEQTLELDETNRPIKKIKGYFKEGGASVATNLHFCDAEDKDVAFYYPKDY